MCILITAFEPFGGAETNITQSVLSLLPDSIADWAIEKVCLPVSFKLAPIVLREAITTYFPDVVIMLGQCGRKYPFRALCYQYDGQHKRR